VKHAGLSAAAGTLPVCIGLGSVAGLLLPGFPAIAGIRGMEILVRGSFYRTAYELFYAPIPPGEKRAVKSLIDVGADRAGDAVGSAGVSLILVLAPGRYGPILALAGGISAIAVLFAARLRDGYLRSLEKSLVDRAVELDPSLVEDAATHSVLMRSVEMGLPAVVVDPPAALQQGRPAAAGGNDPFLRCAADLRSGDASRVIRAEGELGPEDWALAPLAIDLLAWDEAMPGARDALTRMGMKITGMLVDALLDPSRDFVIRRRCRECWLTCRRRDRLTACSGAGGSAVRSSFLCRRALALLLNAHSDLSPAPERVWAAVNR
jgi:hypothetical protein